MSKYKISVALPYHQTPNTAHYLSRLLKTLSKQTLTNYELVITGDGQFAENHNSAIKKSTGEIVQMMQMDDYFTTDNSLQIIADAFDANPDKAWAISACMHYTEGREGNLHQPEWTDDIYTGNNRLGSVSTLAMRRDKALLFEEPLTWLVDTDLYYRLYLKYGEPIYIPTPTVSIDTRLDRLTHTIPNDQKLEEINYCIRKYGK